MECIKCRNFKANKESGWCDDCEQVEYHNINGVLYFPAMGLVMTLLWCSIEMYYIVTMNEIYDIPTKYASTTPILLSVTLISSWLFFNKKKGCRTAMVVYYITEIIIAFYIADYKSFSFDFNLISAETKILLSSLIGIFIWGPYFIFSNRAKNVFIR